MYWTDGLVSFTGSTLLDGASISGHPDRHGGRQTHHGHQLFRKLHVRGLETGKDYMLVVTSRRYRFATRKVSLTENLSDVNLVGLE